MDNFSIFRENKNIFQSQPICAGHIQAVDWNQIELECVLISTNASPTQLLFFKNVVNSKNDSKIRKKLSISL